MFTLKRYNVIKVTDSKHKADRLVREGFTLMSQPVFEKAVTPAPKPSVDAEVKTDEELKCPYCDKEYKSEKALMKHIEEKHSEE